MTPIADVAARVLEDISARLDPAAELLGHHLGPSCQWPRSGERCPSCNGDGTIVVPITVGGTLALVECECADRARRRGLWERSGAAARQFAGFSFANFPGSAAVAGKVQAWLDEPAKPSLYLVGPYGRGKSSLARCAVHAMTVDRGVRSLFTTVPDMLDRIRQGFDRDRHPADADFTDRVMTTPFVVMDDLGSERVTGFAEERLFRIVNYRHDHVLPTLFTSNLELGDELMDHLGARIYERIAEMCAVIRVAGPNLRQTPKPRKESHD